MYYARLYVQAKITSVRDKANSFDSRAQKW